MRDDDDTATWGQLIAVTLTLAALVAVLIAVSAWMVRP